MGVGRVYPTGDSRTCWFAAGSDPAEVMQIVAQVRGTIAGMQPLWRPGGGRTPSAGDVATYHSQVGRQRMWV